MRERAGASSRVPAAAGCHQPDTPRHPAGRPVPLPLPMPCAAPAHVEGLANLLQRLLLAVVQAVAHLDDAALALQGDKGRAGQGGAGQGRPGQCRAGLAGGAGAGTWRGCKQRRRAAQPVGGAAHPFSAAAAAAPPGRPGSPHLAEREQHVVQVLLHHAVVRQLSGVVLRGRSRGGGRGGAEGWVGRGRWVLAAAEAPAD